MSAKNGLPCKKCGGSEWNKWGQCVPCQREAKNQWRIKNPSKMREYNAKWREKNPDKRREAKRRWRRDNSDKKREQDCRYRRSNSKKIAASVSSWKRNNPDRARENNRRYQKNNPEKMIAKVNRRRTQKTAAGGSYTAAEWQALKSQYDHRCLRCGRKEPEIKLTADHVLPVTMGGSSNIDNIQPLCGSCNSSKNNKHIDFRNRPTLVRWIQRTLFD